MIVNLDRSDKRDSRLPKLFIYFYRGVTHELVSVRYCPGVLHCAVKSHDHCYDKSMNYC